MSAHKISVSFKQNYIDVYEFLKTKDNVSHYLCKLVEADMKKEQNSCSLDSKVEEILHRLLQNSNLLQEGVKITGNSLSSEDKDLINQLF